MPHSIKFLIATFCIPAAASATVTFSSSGPNLLTVTFTQPLEVSISPPSPANRVFGDGNLLIFRNAFSSAPTQFSELSLDLTSNTITTSSIGTTLIDGITPASADLSFQVAAQGFDFGVVNPNDFILRLSNNTYIPAGTTGVITFAAGSLTINNWMGNVPDLVVSQVDAALNSNPPTLTTETSLQFIPEPASSTLLLLALGSLFFNRRR